MATFAMEVAKHRFKTLQGGDRFIPYPPIGWRTPRRPRCPPYLGVRIRQYAVSNHLWLLECLDGGYAMAMEDCVKASTLLLQLRFSARPYLFGGMDLMRRNVENRHRYLGVAMAPEMFAE